MNALDNYRRPSKQEQITARTAYEFLADRIHNLKNEEPGIEIEETGKAIKIPRTALLLLAEILKAMSEGQPISLVPIATELTTQAAAEFLGCSRPHLVKLLENGTIPFTKVGKHRRILFEDVVKYKKNAKSDQERRIVEMMRKDEELGLYDS